LQKKSTNKTIKVPILDLPGLGSFQLYHGNEPELELNGTRVSLLFYTDERFYDLCQKYQSNETVKVLDFVNVQRQLKAKVLSLKSRKCYGPGSEK
jgi:hypothetical protein